jgi:hypothetical protein
MVGIISAKEREARSLLECSPVSIWELDLSSVKKACGNVLASGGQFGPDEVAAAIPLVAVTSVNTITLEWLGIDELADVPRWFSSFQEEDTFVLFADELRALAGRAPGASGECRFTMPGGERRVFAVRFATIAGHEDDWARVLVTAADITARTLAARSAWSRLWRRKRAPEGAVPPDPQQPAGRFSLITLRNPAPTIGTDSDAGDTQPSTPWHWPRTRFSIPATSPQWIWGDTCMTWRPCSPMNTGMPRAGSGWTSGPIP